MIKMSKAPKCSTLYNYDHFECISIGDRIKTHKIDGKKCVCIGKEVNERIYHSIRRGKEKRAF